MNITKVQIHVLREPNKGVRGYADIVIDDEFIVRGLVIRENNQNETYVTMPCNIHNDIRRDITHPISNDCRLYIEDKVLDQYELTLNKMAEAKEAREKTLPTPAQYHSYQIFDKIISLGYPSDPITRGHNMIKKDPYLIT